MISTNDPNNSEIILPGYMGVFPESAIGETTYFDAPTTSDEEHVLIITDASIDGEAFSVGDEIAIFDGEILVGGAQYLGEMPMQIETHGITGNEMSFKIYDFSTAREPIVQVTYQTGDGTFGPPSVVSLSGTIYHAREINVTGGKVELISLNVFPENPDASMVFNDLDSLDIAFTDLGKAYIPSYDVNTIGTVDITDGFHVYSQTDDQLSYTGLIQDLSDWPIIIAPNRFNSISYLLNEEADVEIVLEAIAGSVEIILNDDGLIYLPSLGVNTLGTMQPGDGYMIFLSSEVADTLYYNNDDVGSRQFAATNTHESYLYSDRSTFVETGIPYAVIIDNTFIDGGILNLVEGDEISLYDGDLCVGAALFNGQFPFSVTAWGAYPDADLPGFQSGNMIQAKTYLTERETEIEMMVSPMDGFPKTFGQGAYAYVNLNGTSGLVPASYALGQNYPNPFNPVTNIDYQIPVPSNVVISIYNVLGQKVLELINEHQDFGYHEVSWHGRNSHGKQLSSGVYFYRLEATMDDGEKFIQTNKMLLLK